MKLIFWILGLPLLLLAAFFAVANRDPVTVSLWPISEPIEVQLWLVIAVPLYLGFFIGALVAWASGHGTRVRARAAARRAEALQRDNAALQTQLDRMAVPERTLPERALPAADGRVSEQAAPPAFLP